MAKNDKDFLFDFFTHHRLLSGNQAPCTDQMAQMTALSEKKDILAVETEPSHPCTLAEVADGVPPGGLFVVCRQGDSQGVFPAQGCRKNINQSDSIKSDCFTNVFVFYPNASVLSPDVIAFFFSGGFGPISWL